MKRHLLTLMRRFTAAWNFHDELSGEKLPLKETIAAMRKEMEEVYEAPDIQEEAVTPVTTSQEKTQ